MTPIAKTKGWSGSDAAPWTAARCHRLLRQLQTRLAALRKLAEEVHEIHLRPVKRTCCEEIPSRTQKRVRFTYAPKRTVSGQKREAQLAEVTPPRPLRTLGAMDIGKSSPLGGSINLSTPAWKRICELPDTPCAAQQNPLQDAQKGLLENVSSSSSSELQSDLRMLRPLIPENKFHMYEAILHWTDGFLRSTVFDIQDLHPKTLLSLCLRRIPACIANIEAYDRQTAREQGRKSMWEESHASFDLYAQLESLGSARSGWRPLKEAVRYHAVSSLSKAALDGLIEPDCVQLLVRLCIRYECRAEAERLANSVKLPLPVPQSVRSIPTENKRLLPVQEMLASLKRQKCSSAFRINWLSSLVEKDLLPINWLSTKDFPFLWEHVLERLTNAKSASTVVHFLSTCLPLLSSAKHVQGIVTDSTMEQTLMSVVAGMVAAATVRRPEPDFGKREKRRRTWRRVVYILDLASAMLGTRKARHRQTSATDTGHFLFLLARHLAVTGSTFAEGHHRQQAAAELIKVVHAARGDAITKLYHYQAASLLSWLAHYRRKSCASSAEESLTEFCSMLDDLGQHTFFGTSLRTDAAFMLARKTKDLRDLALAESLRDAQGSPDTSEIFSGWCWEAGISEWIQPKPPADAGAPQPSLDDALNRGKQARRLVLLREKKIAAKSLVVKGAKRPVLDRLETNIVSQEQRQQAAKGVISSEIQPAGIRRRFIGKIRLSLSQEDKESMDDLV